MPIYEYRCDSCGHELEKLQRISDDPLKDCPECAEPALRRLISPAGFRLKGSGWYETDFKKDNKRNVVETPSGGDKAAGKDEASKTGDSKSGENGKKDSKAKSSDKGGKSEGSKAASA